MFSRRPCFSKQPLAFLIRTPRSNIRNVEHIDLPFPCQTELWESSGIEEWAGYSRASKSLTLSSAARRIIRQNDSTLKLDTFQSNLILSYSLLTNMRSIDLEQTLEAFIRRMKQGTVAKELVQCSEACGPVTHPSQTLFAYHALLAAYRAPLKAILIVSGESWLYNGKLTDQAEYHQYHQAKIHQAKKALILGHTPGLISPNTGLSLNVHAQSGNDIHRTENVYSTPGSQIEQRAILSQSNEAGPITALHANWTLLSKNICIYIEAACSITAPNFAQEVMVLVLKGLFGDPVQGRISPYSASLYGPGQLWPGLYMLTWPDKAFCSVDSVYNFIQLVKHAKLTVRFIL
ncbi:uncharacterized protein BDCG_16143 [Blastomyces dermatitidis ER-3]|uniref:Uncharacterized protein n=1 Tax=Ajellomyces dermatitidis (strain ER-3 / ATCC MYA-2586) TaxID=559297 RepID=A0ABX2VQC7_AJEDR|nr:uncharacterized protein BDCG_16143 [Blastomyces dermatitidis ER-3]OAS99455.1 hypothetical protein BDCG_16143 [Blastomyces dermatitidis ER-3]